MEVSIFVPCFIDQLYPQVAVKMVQVLRRAGCQVRYNPSQTCCGQPAFNAGFWAEAQDVGEKLLHDTAGKHPIVCPSASCVGFMRNQLPKILEDKGLRPDAEAWAMRVVEFSEFLADKIKVLDFGAKLAGRAVFHDSCAGLRECQIKRAPRRLLEQVQGLELVEMPSAEVCCGFGGTFATKFEPISVAMAEQKVNEALELGADFLISTDQSCLMHLDSYIRQRGYALRCLHLAEVLAQTAPMP